MRNCLYNLILNFQLEIVPMTVLTPPLTNQHILRFTSR